MTTNQGNQTPQEENQDDEYDRIGAYPELVKIAMQIYGDKRQLVQLMKSVANVSIIAAEIFEISLDTDLGRVEEVSDVHRDTLIDLYDSIARFMVYSQQFTVLDEAIWHEAWARARLEFVDEVEAFVKEHQSRITKAALSQGIPGVDLDNIKPS